MEAYLAPTQPTQVNKITTSCEICSGPHDTQYCIEDPEQAFVEYASSRTDEAGEEDDEEVMFIEIIQDDDEPQNEGPNKGEGATTKGPANVEKSSTGLLMTPFITTPMTGQDFLAGQTSRLYLMRRSLEILKKFHWTILG
ncbi:hypothetical protein Tco_0296328 [Tanacetum coccineum]